MCRLLGVLSVTASDAAKYLLEDPCSLYVQSKVNPERLQGDGWGIGFYPDGTAQLIKSEKPVYEDSERYASAARRACSRIVLAHVRRASNPRELPREKLISLENSQPFRHGTYLFAHNGTINIPDEVAGLLGEWKQKIRGFNDSETYFWFIMKEMTNGAGFPEALKDFEKAIQELWRANREKYPNKSRPYIGLNILFSDGINLHAFCKYDEEDEPTRSLCYCDQPVFQMSYLITPDRLVVASEKTNNGDDWKILKSGQLLTGQIKGSKLSIRLQDIGQDKGSSIGL